MVQVLDKGWVELEDSMPGGPAPAADKKIEKRARVSNVLPQLAQEEIRTITQTQGLINYLIKNKHGSPFEGAIFEFYVKCPLFVRSEWMRHRMASYNEMSGRYVEYLPEFYFPDKWRIQAKSNKQGSILPDDSDDFFYSERGLTVRYEREDWHTELSRWLEEENQRAYGTYEHMLKWGVAKEMARMVLPQNLYTAFYVTMNAKSLMNFLSLRNADNAQFEIRQYALAMEAIFEEKMPLTYKAWIANGRVS